MSNAVIVASIEEALAKHESGEGSAFLVTLKSTKAVIPQTSWPIWAKALRFFAEPKDKGIGDVVARMIGDEKSQAFKKWHKKTFGKDCGCVGRQARWNRMYPV